MMRKRVLAMLAGVAMIVTAATVFGQSNLTAIRKSDNTLWTMTYDGTWDDVWTNITETSEGSPSPLGFEGRDCLPETITVKCPRQSLQAAVDTAQTGAVINVTGTCNESVIIREEKHRLTLDGQNVAKINASSGGTPLLVRGRGILIQNFEITGGIFGIGARGSDVVINHNNIHNTNIGIIITSNSVGVIKNNNIHDNSNVGILVDGCSSARIGYETPLDSAPSPNTIQRNIGPGILVQHSSSASIAGNTIANNTGDGVVVLKLSQADIAYNTINQNGGNGINVIDNSGIQLGEDNPVNFYQQPNMTTQNNTGFGINCWLGAYVRGHLGSVNQINGFGGQTNIHSSCPTYLVSP